MKKAYILLAAVALTFAVPSIGWSQDSDGQGGATATQGSGDNGGQPAQPDNGGQPAQPDNGGGAGGSTGGQ